MDFRKNWEIISALATFILGIVGSILFPPPEYLEGESVIANAAQWVAVLAVGLILVPVMKYKDEKSTKGWWILAIVTFALSVGAILSYQHFRQSMTCKCFDEDALILIGTEFQPEARPPKDEECRRTLKKNSCFADRIWTKHSIDSNRTKLSAFYLSILPLMILAMISMLQAVGRHVTDFESDPDPPENP